MHGRVFARHGSKLVVVMMNPGTESEEVELHFGKGDGASIFDACETSRKNDLKLVSRGVKDSRYSFPAESVTTLVIK